MRTVLYMDHKVNKYQQSCHHQRGHQCGLALLNEASSSPYTSLTVASMSDKWPQRSLNSCLECCSWNRLKVAGKTRFVISLVGGLSDADVTIAFGIIAASLPGQELKESENWFHFCKANIIFPGLLSSKTTGS